MIIQSTNQSNYPFITGCSMELCSGIYLSPGVITECLLYPKCGNINYARIGFLGCNSITDNFGYIKLVSDTGTSICSVSFDLSDLSMRPNTITGTGYDAYGDFCGSMTARGELIPLLRGRYFVTSKRNLILSPSAIRPAERPDDKSTHTSLLLADGTALGDIKFNESQFEKDADTGEWVVIQENEAPKDTNTAIHTIRINGVAIDQPGKYINITTAMPTEDNAGNPAGDGIRLSTNYRNIVLGGYRDL